MGTGPFLGQEGWTWPWMIAYGINRVTLDNGYPSYISSSAVNTAYSWPAIQSEIDANRPFELSVFNISVTPISYWGHSYAAVGYGYDSWGSIKYIEVYTTWSAPQPTDKYITFGSWDGAMNTYVRPRYTYTITSSAGPGGSISPAGSVSAPVETTPSFTITPDSGYIIDQILVDNSAVTQNPYTFPPVTADHTISATFKQTTPPGNYWLERVIDVYNGPNGLPAYNNALLGSDLGMYTTLGSDGWIQPAFSDQLDYNAVTSCSVYEYSSYIGVSTLAVNPNDFIDPDYREWNIGTGYETYHVAFIRPNQMKISVIGPGGGNILGAVCTVPGSTAVTASSVAPKVINIIDNQTATTKG